MVFDSHAHLDHRRFDGDREEIFATLRDAGVGHVMNVGCDLTSSMKCIALAKKYPGVYASVGSHPDDAANFSESTLAMYRQLARDPAVKAIGEIGLDYYYDDNPPQVQKPCFLRQMELAAELDLPVILHDRDAHGDVLDIVRRFPTVKGVFHCYSGSAEMAKEVVKLGWYVGFTGVVTFKNARKAVEAAQAVPMDRILAETDCPYMAPEPHRGKRCDSRLVPVTVAKLAEIRGVSYEEMAAAVTENAKRLFRITE